METRDSQFLEGEPKPQQAVLIIQSRGERATYELFYGTEHPDDFPEKLATAIEKKLDPGWRVIETYKSLTVDHESNQPRDDERVRAVVAEALKEVASNTYEIAEEKPTAAVTYNSAGHEDEYTVHLSPYSIDAYIPQNLSEELQKALGSRWLVSNRGTRLEILGPQDDLDVQAAIEQTFGGQFKVTFTAHESRSPENGDRQ